jgi:hypothetical protein
LVDAGVIIGTLPSCATGAAARLFVDETSPIIACTLSSLTNLDTIVLAGSGFPWSSSTISWIFLPLTPPALFISSAASSAPFFADWPKLDVWPLRSRKTPTFMVSPVEGAEVFPPCWTQANTRSMEKTKMVVAKTLVIFTSLIRIRLYEDTCAMTDSRRRKDTAVWTST